MKLYRILALGGGKCLGHDTKWSALFECDKYSNQPRENSNYLPDCFSCANQISSIRISESDYKTHDS